MINLEIRLTKTSPLDFCDMALEFGAQSAFINAESLDKEWFDEPGEDSLETFTGGTVTLLLDSKTGAKTILDQLQTFFGIEEPFQIKLERLEEKDWVAETEKNFKPVFINHNLTITPHCTENNLKGSKQIILDPGIAFGTGRHPTTFLCLDWISRNNVKGKKVLDYGCGSGILGIAAKIFGSNKVVAVDIDPQALDATKRNAQINHTRLMIISPDELTENKFDIIVANILANPLKNLNSKFHYLSKPGTRLLLSGIMTRQIEEIKQAYAQLFAFDVPIIQEDWVLLQGVYL